MAAATVGPGGGNVLGGPGSSRAGDDADGEASRGSATSAASAACDAAQGAGAAGRHVPVLLEDCLDLLAPALGAGPGSDRTAGAVSEARTTVMVDCTLGAGGHTEAALDRFNGLSVIGIDRDPQALAVASARLARFGGRFRAVHAVYDQIGDVVRDHAAQLGGRDDGTVDAVLMDLGVSSLQLDEVRRGFSYARPAPLDMRMDQTTGRTARELLETEDATGIARILRTYGEERFADRIARAIVRRREAGRPVVSSEELADLVRKAVPAPSRRSGGHPAKRTFQALRIAVNAELDALARAVPRALNCLRVGGRLVVESYHSLEDRVVKQVLASGASDRAPDGLPVVPRTDQPYLVLLTRGALRPGPDEVTANPRSASVRLRAAERTRSAQEAPAPEPGGGTPGGSRPGAGAAGGRAGRKTHSNRRGRAHR